MGGGASQDTAAMREAGQAIENAFEMVQGEKAKMQQAKETVLTPWQGTASKSFQRAMDNFLEKMQAQLQILNDLRDRMGQAELSYAVSADETNQAVSDVEAMLA